MGHVSGEILRGSAWLFGDDISTDHIAPGRLFHLRTDMPELAKHVMEDARPEFASTVRPGDFIVGGRNSANSARLARVSGGNPAR